MAGFGFGNVGFVGSLAGVMPAVPAVPVAPYAALTNALTYVGTWYGETGYGGPFDGVIRYPDFVGATATSRTIYGQVFSFWAHKYAATGNVRFEVLRASDNTVAFSIELPNATVTDKTIIKQAESPTLPLGTYYCRMTTLSAYSAINAFYCSA